MHTPHLESASTLGFFSPVSRVLPPFLAFAPLRAQSICFSKMPVMHVACWKMTMSGTNAWQRQAIWLWVINCVTYLLASFVTALLQLQESCGTHLHLTSVMTSGACFCSFVLVVVISPRYELEKYKRLIRACDCRTPLLVQRQVTHTYKSQWSDPRLISFISRIRGKWSHCV